MRVKYLPSSVRKEENIQIVSLGALSLLYSVAEKVFNDMKHFSFLCSVYLYVKIHHLIFGLVFKSTRKEKC